MTFEDLKNCIMRREGISAEKAKEKIKKEMVRVGDIFEKLDNADKPKWKL